MLVLSRKVGQTIWVGDSIKVTVIDLLNNGTIRIGIEAPNSMEIMREELLAKRELMRTQAEKEARRRDYDGQG